MITRLGEIAPLCKIIIILAATILLAACAPQPAARLPSLTPIPSNADVTTHPGLESSTLSAMPTNTSSPTPRSTGTPIASIRYGYTNINPDGNRFLEGKSSFPHVKPIDIPLDAKPLWLVSVADERGSIWAASLENGQVRAFRIEKGSYSPVELFPSELPAGMPPVLQGEHGAVSLLLPPTEDISTLTHAVPLGERPGDLAFINNKGNVVILRGGQQHELQVNALPDARLLVDERQRLSLLTNPTERYAHGVLGDNLEAAGFAIIETLPDVKIAHQISIPSPQVIEGIAPVWVDINNDGQREVLFVLSDINQGARVAIYAENGKELASSDSIGQGYRWRNPLAVVPSDIPEEMFIVDVLTPHIGGIVEFFAWRGSHLPILSQISGFTSHVLGTRNLDMGLAGDFDGDGLPETVLPNQTLDEIAGIAFDGNQARVVWRLAAGGAISTNLSAVNAVTSGLWLGVGTEKGFLRIWGRW